jgi:hypothetical protein
VYRLRPSGHLTGSIQISVVISRLSAILTLRRFVILMDEAADEWRSLLGKYLEPQHELLVRQVVIFCRLRSSATARR